MKLWQKNIESLKEVESFTVGKDREFDLLLAPFDILGNIAHAQMLATVGLLTSAEAELLTKELRDIYKTTQPSAEGASFTIENDVEDVHSQIEFLLTKKLGDIGKKIHSARSRNDQVLVDVKLFLRSEIEATVHSVEALFQLLIARSNELKDDLLPGYTHLQLAMPSSFGLWLGAYAESLVDDLGVMKAAYEVVNKNPLGLGCRLWIFVSHQPHNDHATVGLCRSQLQCSLRANGAWQSRAHCSFGTREYRRYFIALKHGCLPVPEPEFWLYFFPARAYYGQQHYAA